MLHCVQVFDVVLNKAHAIVSDLDIFSKVGKAAAHDEVTRFTIENGKLMVQDETSNFRGTLSVEFAKVSGHSTNSIEREKSHNACGMLYTYYG